MRYVFRTTQAAFKTPWDDGDSSGEGRGARGLLHLEHVNVAIPTHGPARRLYYDILGFRPDVRRAQNLGKGSGTIWANMGTSQIHMPEGELSYVALVYLSVRSFAVHRSNACISFESTRISFVENTQAGNRREWGRCG